MSSSIILGRYLEMLNFKHKKSFRFYSEALFVHQENKLHPIETPTLKVGLFCIGSYPKFIDGPK